jgi:hypothetical protein
MIKMRDDDRLIIWLAALAFIAVLMVIQTSQRLTQAYSMLAENEQAYENMRELLVLTILERNPPDA